MLDRENFTRIVKALPFLQRADAGLVGEFKQAAFLAKITKGKDVFIEGDQCDAIALLISGVVRVYKIGETGREITLYRFGLGESCILTANAILSSTILPGDCDRRTGGRSHNDSRRKISRMGQPLRYVAQVCF